MPGLVTGWNPDRIARAWVEFMQRLGYRRSAREPRYRAGRTSSLSRRSLLFTGLRREALCLRSDNVDLKRGTLRVIDTKNGSDHLLPMGNHLWNLMRARSRMSDSEWVFANPLVAVASPTRIADRERCRKERRPVLSARPAANLRLDCESPRSSAVEGSCCDGLVSSGSEQHVRSLRRRNSAKAS